MLVTMRLAALLVLLAGCHERTWATGPRWRRTDMPIRVRADLYADETRRALETWNVAAGCTVFVEVRQRPDAIIMPGGASPHLGATTWMGGRAVVYVFTSGSPWAESVIVHELGHVLGLAHDVSTDSIMHPHAAGGALDDDAPGRRTVSGADRAALHQSYCQESSP